MGVNRLNSVQKATNLKKKTEVGINEKDACIEIVGSQKKTNDEVTES